MKKTIISTLKIAAVTVILASCNNAEEAKKLQEADNAAVQSSVDAKLAGLQEQVNAECTAWIDSSANAQYAAWYEIESKKPGKKPTVKPKPKPTEPKKEEPKTGGLGDGKQGTAKDNSDAKLGEGKQGTKTDTAKLGKGKIGTKPKTN